MGESTSTFHVVCRDCRTEEVERTEQAAEEAAAQHRSAGAHRVVFEPFERAVSPQQASD